MLGPPYSVSMGHEGSGEQNGGGKVRHEVWEDQNGGGGSKELDGKERWT